MNRCIRYYFIGAFALLLVACSRKIVINNPEKLERRKTSELVGTLDSLYLLKPNFFYTKISTHFQDTNQSISFKTSIRMVKDSAVNALITFAALPIFNSMLTPDSLTILNKRNKCYTKTRLSYLKDNFGYAFDYKNVEELILGLPLAYDTNQKYFQIHDPFNYIISSHRKREIRRNDKGKPDKPERNINLRLDRNERNGNNTENKEGDDEIIIKYYLTNDAKGLKRMDIESPGDTTRVQVDYISREVVDNYNIPKEVFVQVFTPRNVIHVNLDYEKVEINQPQPLIMTIPESYEICE